MYLSGCPERRCTELQNISGEYSIIVTCRDTAGIAASKNIKVVVTDSAFGPSTGSIVSEVPTETTLSKGKSDSVLISQPATINSTII